MVTGGARIIVGDVRAVLPTLADASVNCVVTSPPYWGLRDYGVSGQLGLEPTPEEYVAAMVGVFRDVRRVLRPDGVCWVNLGDSYISNPASAKRVGDSHRGSETASLNTAQQCRVSIRGGGFKPKDLVGIPWTVALALRADGWWLRSEVIWHKTAPMPESVTDRPTKAHEQVFLLTRSETYAYDAEAVAEAAVRAGDTPGGNRKVDASRNDAARDMTIPVSDTRNLRSVWTLGPDPYPGAHFATFPRRLAERCILAGCPAGGVVLDPFCGTGTAGSVATGTGRSFVGIEINPEYARLAQERIGMFAKVEHHRTEGAA